MTGDVPIRASAHSGLAPVPGWTDAYEWQGTIPFELLPQLLNPPRGYIINADQSVAPSSYWDFLKREIGTPNNVRFQAPLAADGYRARRIAELLNETRPHSSETFRAMQLDDVLLSAQDLLPLLAEVSMETGELIDVREWLESWNCRMGVDSAQAALYALLWRALVEELYADNLHGLSAAGILPMWVTVELLAEPSNPWWDDVTPRAVVEHRKDILQRALTVAYARAVEKLGRNRDAWRWGDLHKATFVNPVSGCNESSIVKQLVNRGPYPIAGASSCINAVGSEGESGKETYFGVDLAPVMRMVVDLGAVEESVAINSTGQSGHVASEHYDDMIEPWLAGEYHPMLWERQQVENSAVERLVLYPRTADTECCESEDGRLE